MCEHGASGGGFKEWGGDSVENRPCLVHPPSLQNLDKMYLALSVYHEQTRRKCPSKPSAAMIQRNIYKCFYSTYDPTDLTFPKIQ